MQSLSWINGTKHSVMATLSALHNVQSALCNFYQYYDKQETHLSNQKET